MTENKTLLDEVSENDVDNFKAIYLILRQLEKVMDSNDANNTLPKPSSLGITEYRMFALMRMLVNGGYIDTELCITLKGLEYLETSSLLKKYRGY